MLCLFKYAAFETRVTRVTGVTQFAREILFRLEFALSSVTLITTLEKCPNTRLKQILQNIKIN